MYIEAPELGIQVTPKVARSLPIYNWFIYPHSYSPELVWRLIDDFGLTPKDQIFDPFLGAATTLLAAKQRGIPAVGLDLLPISATLAQAKIGDFEKERLTSYLDLIMSYDQPSRKKPARSITKLYEQLDGIIARAFDENTFTAIIRLKKAIVKVVDDEQYRAFFMTCLMYLFESFSRTEKSGGWLKITDAAKNSGDFWIAFKDRARIMISEVSDSHSFSRQWRVIVGDARKHHPEVGSCTAVISSPPYLNRHDYTRVLSLELLIAILEEEESIKPLRYQLLRSHIEAKPYSAEADYQIPKTLQKVMNELHKQKTEKRILYITQGYFEDLYTVLKRSSEYLTVGGKLAFVLGNVRFSGVGIPVDDILVEMGNKIGFKWHSTLVARRRNNSAQQMRDFGRDPSRESIIILKKI